MDIEVKESVMTVEDIDREMPGSFDAQERQIRRKIDYRLLPVVIMLYTVSLVDRSNLGTARISGIDNDLGLDQGNHYSVVVLVFYIGYVIFELPSNMAMRKFGADNWLALLTFCWGLITLGIGFVHNYGGLLGLRIVLGCLEAGLFPGCLYLISTWYRRYELQKRISIFFTSAAFLSSFANILAYGLANIADKPAEDGWRWIFIVEGALTCGLGVLTRFCLIDFAGSPRNKFLTEQETIVIKHRITSENGDTEGSQITWATIWSVMKKWHVWTTAIIYMSGSCGAYGFIFFLPVILRNGLGYSLVSSFCLTAPPAAVAVVFSLAMSWLSDKTQKRGFFALGHCILSIAGLAMTGFAKSSTPRYVGAFLGEAGTSALISTALAWGQNNIRTDATRGVVTVVQVIFAALGGIYSALVFRQQDSPDYVPGLVATGALILLAAFLSCITSFFLWRANARANKEREMLEGDLNFRYTW